MKKYDLESMSRGISYMK